MNPLLHCYAILVVTCFVQVLVSANKKLDTSKPSYWYSLGEHIFRCAFCKDKDVQKQTPFPNECFERLMNNVITEETHYGEQWSPLCLNTGGTDGGYYKNCTAVPVVEGAHVNCKDGILVDDVCTVTTEDRFSAVPNVTTCQYNGTWTPFKVVATNCIPLKEKLLSLDVTSCDKTEYLPIGSLCNVSCSNNNSQRIIRCDENGEWNIQQPCIQKLPDVKEDDSFTAVYGLIAGGVILFLIILVIAIYLWRRVRRHELLLGSPTSSQISGSSSSRVSSSKDLDHMKEVVTENGTTVCHVSFPEECQGLLKSDDKMPEADDQQPESSPPEYTPRDACENVKIEFKINESEVEGEIPQHGIKTIFIKEGAILTLWSKCTNAHGIQRFQVPVLNSELAERIHQKRAGVKWQVHQSDNGVELFMGAECSGGGIVFGHVKIVLADENLDPESTGRKTLFGRSRTRLNSFSTCSELPLEVTHDPSEKLGAEPFLQSLSSNPAPLYDEDAGEESLQGDNGAAEAVLPKNADCTLPLSKLKNKEFNKLRLKLEPIASLEMSAGGVAQAGGVIDEDEVRWIIWAKKEDLKDSPARVILQLMTQYGSMAADIVSYFHEPSHRRVDVIQLLQEAHPYCPVCSRFPVC